MPAEVPPVDFTLSERLRQWLIFPRNHAIRIGTVYRRSWGNLAFDNRLIYEAILADQGRDNGNRIRNRSRLTYRINKDSDLAPRLFGYVEPIYDDRFDGIAITNVTLGAGVSAGHFDIDLFLTRLERSERNGSDTNGATVQIFYRF